MSEINCVCMCLNLSWDGVVEEDRGERIRLVCHYESTVYVHDTYAYE